MILKINFRLVNRLALGIRQCGRKNRSIWGFVGSQVKYKAI